MARREYQDPSILTRRGKRGDEYYIRYRVRKTRIVDGKATPYRPEKWEVLGLCSEMTFRQAERKKAEVMRRINGQIYTIESEIPFSKLVEVYRKHRLPELRSTTQVTVSNNLENYIEPYFGTKKLCDIKPEHIHGFITELKLAPTTRKTLRGSLSALYSFAIAWGYWKDVNPVTRAFLIQKLPSTRVREPKIWTKEQLRVILAAVRPDVRLMIETLAWTGMRISECLGLRWRNVDLERGLIHIVERQCRGDVGPPKSAKGKRILPIGILAARYRELKGSSAPEDLVFRRADGQPYKDCELLANYLSPILRGLGLKFPGAGFHTFRRTHLTWMSEDGVTSFELQQQAGHSSVRSVEIYIQPDLDRREASVVRMQTSFQALCERSAGSEKVN